MRSCSTSRRRGARGSPPPSTPRCSPFARASALPRSSTASPRIFDAWRPCMASNEPIRAAVIGSGFGGLAAAIRLATAGVRVTVYEARDLAGGRAYVYQERGFTFDAGPTVITAPHCIDELFSE